MIYSHKTHLISEAMSSSSRLMARDASILIAPDDSWTNDTMESVVCSRIDSTTTRIISQDVRDIQRRRVLVLPSCIWPYAQQLTELDIEFPVILIGSNTSGAINDPLFAFSSNLTNLQLVDVALSDPVTGNGVNGSPFTIDWNAFFEKYPDLVHLRIENAKLSGSFPSSSLPSPLIDIFLGNNMITGTLSPEWFNRSSVVSADRLRFSLVGNSLSGTIPPNLFSYVASNYDSAFAFGAADNNLTGTIPVNLLSDAHPNTFYADIVQIDFHGNGLTGTISQELMNITILPRASSFTFDVSSNALTGLIASDLFSAISAPSLRHFYFFANNNQLEGSVPTFLDHLQLPSASNVAFRLANNSLSGTLPSRLTPASYGPSSSSINIEYDLSGNQLTGTLPSTILLSNPGDLRIKLSSNSLNGTIPSDLLLPINGRVFLYADNNEFSGPLEIAPRTSGRVHLYFDFNDFGGPLPMDLLSHGVFTSSGSTLTLSLSNCGFGGSLPSSLPSPPGGIDLNLSSNNLTGSFNFSEWLVNSTSFLTPTSRTYNFNAANNQLTGDISIPSVATRIASTYSVNLENNNFTSLHIYTPISYLRSFIVSSNEELEGTLPTELFYAGLGTFHAKNTKLSGIFPNSTFATTGLRSLDLSNTDIDFCSPDDRPDFIAPVLYECILFNTNVADCASKYPSVCQNVEAPPAPTSEPSSGPSAPSAPNSTPSSNPSSPQSTSPTATPDVSPSVPSATPDSSPTPSGASASFKPSLLIALTWMALALILG